MHRLCVITCVLAYVISCLCSTTLYAAGITYLQTTEPDKVITEKFAIFYRFDRIDVDSTYRSNHETIKHIREYLLNSPRIDSITIYAWASPEGARHHNEWLSEKRAFAAKEYLLSLSSDSQMLNDEKINISPLAENWPGLEQMVAERYARYDRDRVLEILRDGSISDETRKWRLRQLDNGYTWNYLWRNYMPELRAATWVCVWMKPVAVLPEMPLLVAKSYTSEKSLVRPQYTPPMQELCILGLKTNLLYDAVTALNVEIEVPVMDTWSVAVEGVFPWWTWGPNDNKYAFQILQLGVEPRWWFRKGAEGKRLTGHFIGAYAMSSMFDLQWDKALCYQGETWSAGLTYGYSFPIGKLLQLELSASAGYLQADYRHYQPDPEYNHLYIDKYKTGKLDYFGLTKLKVSLVVPINVLKKVRR